MRWTRFIYDSMTKDLQAIVSEAASADYHSNDCEVDSMQQLVSSLVTLMRLLSTTSKTRLFHVFNISLYYNINLNLIKV